MKKPLFSVVALIILAILFYPQETISLSIGSPGGKTGSPSDNVNCMQCHSVLSTTSSLTSIVSNIPSSGYVPETIYTITATLNPLSILSGFEVTCEEDATGLKTGTFFTNSSFIGETQMVNNGTAVTHTASGNTLNTWSFDWEAPIAGTGEITFYGAFIEAGYPLGSNIGDYFSSSTLTISESILVVGCTDSLALNYDILATLDDGSCIYCQATIIDSINSSVACTGDTLIIYGSNICGQMKVHLQGWSIPDSLVVSSTSNEVVWILPSTNFSFTVVSLRYIDTNNISSYTNTLSLSNGVEGCTDAVADNYNSLATCNDGSCTYNPLGDLFISEYAEGTSYNKYIEIYNGTGYNVDLSDYEIWKIINGGNWPESSLSLAGILANNEVYIICSSNSNVNSSVNILADTLWGGANWNGNDAVGLAKNGVLIDAIGNGVDPGSAWNVAGVLEATKEHTLIRKCSVTQGDTNWIASAGVDSLTSQWLVYPQDYWVDINQHSGLCGCTDTLACNYDPLVNTDDGSCVYDVIWQQAEIICYGDSIIVGPNTYYDNGNYTDTLNTIYGCDSIVYSYISFYQSLPLFINTDPNPAEICIGEDILLEGSPGFSYYWWNNGSTGSSLIDTPIVDTWYLLSAKDSNDCVVKEDIWVLVDSCITGFNDINSFEEVLLVYPNPASNKLTINFMVKVTSIRVYNMLGELVIEKSIMEEQNRLQLNVGDWQTAIYNIQLYNNGGVIANKVFNVVR